MTHEELHIRIDSFSELKEDWHDDGACEITNESIFSAHVVLDTLLKDKEHIYVFPMRNGGIQFENIDVQDYDIYDNDITEIHYNEEYDIVKIVKIDINKLLRKQKMERTLK
jgi:hypothetical protein